MASGVILPSLSSSGAAGPPVADVSSFAKKAQPKTGDDALTTTDGGRGGSSAPPSSSTIGEAPRNQERMRAGSEEEDQQEGLYGGPDKHVMHKERGTRGRIGCTSREFVIFFGFWICQRVDGGCQRVLGGLSTSYGYGRECDITSSSVPTNSPHKT